MKRVLFFLLRSHAHIESSLDLPLLMYINYQTWMGDADCASLIGYYMTHIHIVTQVKGEKKHKSMLSSEATQNS